MALLNHTLLLALSLMATGVIFFCIFMLICVGGKANEMRTITKLIFHIGIYGIFSGGFAYLCSFIMLILYGLGWL